jgi:hypothetical protein
MKEGSKKEEAKRMKKKEIEACLLVVDNGRKEF